MSSIAVRIAGGSVLTTRAGEPVFVRGGQAEGSFARVYRGAYGRDGMPCGVKAPKPEVARSGELLELQGDLLQAVTSPHLVRLWDRGESEGTGFLVLEWLDGDTLADEIARRRRVALRQALAWLERVAEATAAIHAHRWPHGDLRPENVMLVPGRGAVVIDPHALALGNVPPPSIPADLQALAGVFHTMVTGEPVGRGCRFNAAAGYNRPAVALFEHLRSGKLSAAELAEETRRLRLQL
jgi:serine/threonine protein kinase